RLSPTAMTRPTERCAVPDGVPHIEPRAAFDQEPHHRLMPRQHRLMQWCRMRMVAFRIVAVGVLPGIEQQANDLQMSVLRCEGERAVARFGVRGREETGGIVPEAKACGGGQIDTCAALCQDGGCIAHPEGERGQERASPFPG